MTDANENTSNGSSIEVTRCSDDVSDESIVSQKLAERAVFQGIGKRKAIHTV